MLQRSLTPVDRRATQRMRADVTRSQDVNDARAAADEWAAQRGLPPSGGYSGRWYIDAYLFGWWPDGWAQWLADYSQPAGALLDGNLVVGHQYTSTPVDRSVFEDSEIVNGGGGDVTDPEREAMQETIDGLVNTLGMLVGDDMKALLRKNAGQYVKDYVNVARARADAVGVGHV